MYQPAPYILAAFLLIYAPHFVAGFFRSKMEGGYDNRHPRAQQAQLTGLAARAVGAHNNGFEAFPAFAVGALLCAWLKVDAGTATALTITFVVARVVYIGFYLGNQPMLRSSAWFVGFGATLGLLGMACAA